MVSPASHIPLLLHALHELFSQPSAHGLSVHCFPSALQVWSTDASLHFVSFAVQTCWLMHAAPCSPSFFLHISPELQAVFIPPVGGCQHAINGHKMLVVFLHSIFTIFSLSNAIPSKFALKGAKASFAAWSFGFRQISSQALPPEYLLSSALQEELSMFITGGRANSHNAPMTIIAPRIMQIEEKQIPFRFNQNTFFLMLNYCFSHF